MWIRIIGAAALTLGLIACSKAINSHTAKQPLSDLAGSEWEPINQDKWPDQFVAFKVDGNLSGSGGCNNFFGSYELKDGGLIIGPIASTKKFCQGRMQAEQSFLSSLQQARKIHATHTRLSLYGEDGIKVLDLRRRDWD